LLHLLLLPLFISVIVALFRMDLKSFLLDTLAFLLFFAVLWFSKKGFAQEIAYHRATLTKAPKYRYKEWSAYLLGIATFYTAWVAGRASLGESLFWSVIAVLGYWLLYGFDPRGNKIEDLEDISADVVLDTLHEAQGKIAMLDREITKIHDPDVHSRVARALEHAKTILDTIAEHPVQIRSARKFLIVYIDGVAKVTSSYTAMDEQEITPESREKLLKLMEEVEARFQKELKRLKANNQFDLDVHIDVLKEQIKH
jgi:hypothetical protein